MSNYVNPHNISIIQEAAKGLLPLSFKELSYLLGLKIAPRATENQRQVIYRVSLMLYRLYNSNQHGGN